MKKRKTPVSTIIGNKLKEYSRLVTAPVRSLPSFVIIGTARGGTTSLFNYLTVHPQIVAPVKKEIAYFCTHYNKGTNWYKLHFPKISELKGNPAKVTGEASPYYLSHPMAAARMKQLIPDVKLIVLLRDPVERAFSSYKNIRKIGLETLTFEEAIAKEKERTGGEFEKIIEDLSYYSRLHQHYSYLGRGIYHIELERWFTQFPKEQILILNSETLYSDPASVYNQAVAFLGLEKHTPEGFKVFNETRSTESIPADLRKELYDFYRPHNEKLFKLINRRFNWDI